MEQVSIQTTQNVVIDYEVASVGDRILATLLDYLFFFGWVLAIALIASATDNFGNSIALFVLIMFVPLLLYDLALEAFMNGQSFGKRIMKIKVVKLNGTQPAFGAYLIRWIFRLVDMRLFSGVVALVAVLLNGRGQRLGDMAAGTTVIKVKQRVRLQDTILHRPSPGRQVVFTEVENLSGRDVAIIKDVLMMSKRTNSTEALEKLAAKTKEVLGVETEMPPTQFLETVLKDYNRFQFEE